MEFMMKKGVINGKIYDIKSEEEFMNNPTDDTDIAVEYDNFILPVRGKMTPSPSQGGVYNAGPLVFFITPSEEKAEEYRSVDVVDFTDRDNIKSILDKQDVLSKMAEPWITNPENITQFTITTEDQPEMKLLKTALNEKHMDFDKYGPRFGENFPNDKRQMKNTSATLNIIKRYCDKLDMEAIMVLTDKDDKAPNPIGKTLAISLTGENPDIEEIVLSEQHNFKSSVVDDEDEDF